MKTKDLVKIANNNKTVTKKSRVLMCVMASMLATIGMSSLVFADGESAIENLGNIFGNLAQQIFSTVILVSTILAGAIIAVCMVIRMISKNQRSVDEANQWIKRVLITWVCLNGIALFLSLATQVSNSMGGTNGISFTGGGST